MPGPVVGVPQIFSAATKIILLLLLIGVTAIGGLWVRSYWPDDSEPANIVCSADAPNWNAGSRLKVMSFNVQYMASKNYVFFYDIDLDDQDRVNAVRNLNKTIASRPSREHVLWTLDKVAEYLKQNPDLKVEIQGHTDNLGSIAYNTKLSEKRARAVEKYMLNKGVPSGQVTSAGYGPSMPIASNDTPGGRASNRRVEFKQIP